MRNGLKSKMASDGSDSRREKASENVVNETPKPSGKARKLSIAARNAAWNS